MHICRLLLLVFAALIASASGAGAQTTDEFFDLNTLQEVHLWVNSKDLQQLKAHFTENTYYTADFEWRGIRVRNVGIRNRGSGSRNGTKLGLRVEFNHYASTQTFLGMPTLIMRNLWQDPSLIHEGVAMAFFARMGQPASRESYARVFINNVYSGVYGLVENVDTLFLRRTLGASDGYLFEYQYTFPYYATDLGDDLTRYRTLFEPEAPHRLDSDTTLFTSIRNLFKEINRAVDDTWRAGVERYLDVGQFLTHIANENFLAELDGFLGYAGMNNFYMYRPTGSDQHRLIVWDKSETFYATDFPVFQRADENVLMRGLLSFPELRSTYLDLVLAAANSAAETETEGGPNWLEREITRQSDLIRDAVYADTFKQFTNEQFDNEIERLKGFARERSAFVAAEVTKNREAGR
jgi:spore coat protein CotH